MTIWSKEEERTLRDLKLSPYRDSPEKLITLIQHFMNNGTVYAVTEGDGSINVSKDLARKVRGLTQEGKLEWILHRGEMPSEEQRNTEDAELGPHQRELYYFGLRLRYRLSLPRPDQVAQLDPDRSSNEIDLWAGPGFEEVTHNDEDEEIEKEWGFERFDALSHPVFADFRCHLSDSDCWEVLNSVKKNYATYVSACREVSEQIESNIGERLPHLASCEVRAITSSLLSSIYRPSTGGHWIEFDYNPVKTEGGWAVQLGAWRVGSRSGPDALGAIIDVHRDLVEETVKWKSSSRLSEAHQSVQRRIDTFHSSLKPNSLLRRLIIQGRCDNCH